MFYDDLFDALSDALFDSLFDLDGLLNACDIMVYDIT